MIDVKRTIEHVVGAIGAAEERREPFHHLRLAGFFPADVYSAILDTMPGQANYGEMSGRARHTRAIDGGSARTRIDLFPEGMIRLPEDKKRVWHAIGQVLRSSEVGEAYIRRLAPGLEKRFGPGFRNVRMYPVPLLTRDVPGYRIGIHTDTGWKGITTQVYLPRDESIRHVGTIFHERKAGTGELVAERLPFSPNTGYAFAVGPDTYHSVDSVGPEVQTRDSILLNYFVDDTLLQLAKNRSKRFGHLVRGLGLRRPHAGGDG